MEAREYFDILRRRWLSVLVIALTTLTVASLLTLAMPKKYTATTELFFAVAGESVSELAQGSSFAAKQMSSYANVATSPLVLEPVVRQLALPTTATELEKSVEVSVPENQVILEVAVTDASPRRAAEIANAVGVTLGKVVGSLSPSRQDGGEAVRATTLRIAEVPTVPSSPDIPSNLGIGLVLGLLLGIGIAILRHLLDTKVRSEQDVRALTDSPILGVVAFDKKVPSHPVILRDEPLAAPSEAVRRLRTNLQFIDAANRPKSIVISSSIPGEGKSTMAINLAVSLADAGARVILVDADFRRPSIADYAGIEGSVGLTTVLIGRADVEDVVQPMGTTTLDLLPAGQIPPNPSELLGSRAMAGLLDRLTTSYDMVLLDSPPLLPVTDAAVLSKLSGGAVVIVGADRIHRPQLQETLGSLQTAGVHVLGIVLNKIDRREASAYSYDSGYAPANVGTPVAVASRARGSASAHSVEVSQKTVLTPVKTAEPATNAKSSSPPSQIVKTSDRTVEPATDAKPSPAPDQTVNASDQTDNTSDKTAEPTTDAKPSSPPEVIVNTSDQTDNRSDKTAEAASDAVPSSASDETDNTSDQTAEPTTDAKPSSPPDQTVNTSDQTDNKPEPASDAVPSSASDETVEMPATMTRKRLPAAAR